MSASLHDVRFTPKSGHQNLAGVSASAAPISHDEARCLAPRWTTAAGSDVQAIQRPQSSSASRLTAGALGFFTFTQCGDRPEP
jgi:hypothetical protein